MSKIDDFKQFIASLEDKRNSYFSQAIEELFSEERKEIETILDLIQDLDDKKSNIIFQYYIDLKVHPINVSISYGQWGTMDNKTNGDLFEEVKKELNKLSDKEFIKFIDKWKRDRKIEFKFYYKKKDKEIVKMELIDAIINHYPELLIETNDDLPKWEHSIGHIMWN